MSRTINSKINEQWCTMHWEQIRNTFGTPEPVNGLLISVEMMNRWLNIKVEQLGSNMPAPSDIDAMTRLMNTDSPICCFLPPEDFIAAKESSLLPEEYRHLSPAIGHRKHLEDVLSGPNHN